MLQLCLFSLKNKNKTPRAHGTVVGEKVRRGKRQTSLVTTIKLCPSEPLLCNNEEEIMINKQNKDWAGKGKSVYMI